MKNAAQKTALGIAAAVLTSFILFAPEDAAAAEYNFIIRLSPFIPTELAGRDLNGVALSGKLLDGHLLVAVSKKAVKHNGHEVVLDTTKGRIKKISDRDLERTEFEGILDDGSRLPIRVDEVFYEPLNQDEKGHGKGHALGLYAVSYETESGWLPLCGTDGFGNPVPAIPLEGRWDYREGIPGGGAHIDDPEVFTFACRGYVLEKCVSAGYIPWGEASVCDETSGRGKKSECETFTLRDHHQACTRMLRADFCGDGTAHTVDGIIVSLYDGLGIRLDTEDWSFEAEWDEDGAICAMRDRLGDELPACADSLDDPTCGDALHLTEGALLFSEVLP